MKQLVVCDTLTADFADGFLPRTKCQLDLQALDEPLDEADLLKTLKTLNTQPLVRTGGLRCFYVDGERYAFGAKAQVAVKALCDHDTVSHTLVRGGLKNPQFVAALTVWVNAGYWYFQD
jgi:50S ribosomal protein L16 3-hydroxylase